jgi:hypothetical protein
LNGKRNNKEDLKEKLSSSPVLMFLDFNKPFEIIHIDVSDVTIGRVFMQKRHSTALRTRKFIEHHWVKTFLGVNTRNHFKESLRNQKWPNHFPRPFT